MYTPRPHGLSSVGEPLTEADGAAVELLARRLTNLRQISGVESLKMVRDLPDGGYVIAQDMGGVFRAIAHKPQRAGLREESTGLVGIEIPMLFSGVITQAIVRDPGGVGLKLTEQTRKRLIGYASGEDAPPLPPKDVSLQRFRIAYGELFPELQPQGMAGLYAFYSQYVQQRPTWYSGAMAEVMQIVGGYGRQDADSLPDDPVERARMVLPARVAKGIAAELNSLRLPGYTGLAPRSGQFQYDYKFNRTDAVAFDTDNQPWIVRVQSDGVWVMPLPLIPATTTLAFRQYMDTVGDGEILAILDRFGGLPSGESFPRKEKDFQAWRRAGVIIKVCAVADFYEHIAYASACGWSFNRSGTEAINTCYDYYDDEGLGYGLTYTLRLKLAPATVGGRLPPNAPKDPMEARKLNAYLAGLYRLMRVGNATHLAIKYKLRRVPPDDILARAGGEVGQNEVDYWDNRELAPIATHQGSVREVGRGYLYHPAKFEFQPQIKFPEPFLGGCVSHDFLPLINGRYKDRYPNCDTTMFGYYIGDDLKVVKYFRDERSYQREVENDYVPCMSVGAWSQTETSGPTSLVGNFSTTDMDERTALAPTVTQTRIAGRDLGYDSKPFFRFFFFFSTDGAMWRNRYCSRQTEIETREGQSLEVAICIPYLMRDAALHAKRQAVTGKRLSEQMELKSVKDPNGYLYWTYHFVWAWAGGGGAPHIGVPSPQNGNPVWVTKYLYNPAPCSDYADQGDWVGALPADYTGLIHPDANTWQQSGGGGPPKLKTYYQQTEAGGHESGDLRISILLRPDTVFETIPDNGYFLGSPDPLLGVFHRDACKAVFGDRTYANVDETVGERRKHWGYSALADHQSAHHFIGVINE